MTGVDPLYRPSDVAPEMTPSRSNLALRVISAAILVPLVLGVTYVGGWPFVALWGAAALGIVWEWSKLVFGGLRATYAVPGCVALITAIMLAGGGWPGPAVLIILIGATAAGMIAPAGQRHWAGGGVLYAGAAFAGPVLLRQDPEFGFIALIFLFAVVWTSDIVAYFAGRAIGGPKLWPRVSPHKTWSGAIAGTLGAVAIAAATILVAGIGSVASALVIGLTLSVISQAGDLFESGVKRRFAAKDTSELIPGHGGLMDRLDGFLVAAVAAVLIGISRQGLDAPARGLLIW